MPSPQGEGQGEGCIRMLKLYDTMTRTVSEVEPSKPGAVGIYTCGPTVYRDAHLGNLRSYLMTDWARRTLEAQGIAVTHVKNITDVGHMRQEMLEQGGDKVIAQAIAEGKTPQEIAQFYTERFLLDEQALNISPAHHFPRATDHVEDMIAITEKLVERGYAYEVEGNVYFEVSTFPAYGALSGNTQQEGLRVGVRVEADPLKRNQRDFTLWKAAEEGRELKWPSPWGEGFPGWHIECSAMSTKYLGEEFDIHTGGVDNIFPHHEAEIAQSEGFTGSQVVRKWVHAQHLLADGVKMAKSAGNTFTVADIEERGIDPMAFRYLCLTSRYSNRLNFTFTALKAAERALHRLRNRMWEWSALDLPGGSDDAAEEWERQLLDRANDNLDMPGALALTWKMVRSDLPAHWKRQTLRDFDRVLGLDLDRTVAEDYAVPDDVYSRLEERSSLRQKAVQALIEARGLNRRAVRRAFKLSREFYEQADAVRVELAESGYVVDDTPTGTRVRPKSAWERRQEPWEPISASTNVDSLVDEPDTVDATIGVIAANYIDDVSRCVQSALRWTKHRPVELVVVDNGSTDGTGEWLQDIASKDDRIRLIHVDHVLGEGAVKNVVLKQARGRMIVMLDTSVELRGDILGPLEGLLGDEGVGVAGPFGLRTADLHHFHDGEGETGDMDAMQAYCFAFTRNRLKDVGFMRETFRFYRNLDLDYSFHFRDKGLRIVADPTLPIRRYEHRVWSELGENEREELSRKNYGRFLDKWGERSDLLVGEPATEMAVPDAQTAVEATD